MQPTKKRNTKNQIPQVIESASEHKQKKELEKSVNVLVQEFRNLLSLQKDTDEEGTIESIKKGIDFRGGNLWSLIFAIFIASVGLNINSTAVIIGAMLISPLMGPIMGIGLAVGIYDFPLLKRSMRNLSIAAFFSILTSAIYFTITPLSEAQSELLARTNPTIYDVIIAFFGGATGIIAGSRRDKSNAIPGVAIATALMPPLCTAGYGIATGQWKFFFGAFYLFFINTLFISITTFIFVRFLNFKKVTFIDRHLEKKVKIYMVGFALVTALPSIFLAYNVIKETIFRANANRFVTENFAFQDSKVLNSAFAYSPRESTIEVSIIGEPLSEQIIQLLESKLQFYSLQQVKLKVNQSKYRQDNTNEVIDKNFITRLYKNNEKLIKSKDDRIKLLENELMSLRNKESLLPKVAKEVSFLFPRVEHFSFGDLLTSQTQDFSSQKEPTVLVKWKNKTPTAEKKKLLLYLQSRLELENLKQLDY